MNRRHFLQSLAALAAAPAVSAEPAWKLNYMLASSMYGNLPLVEIVPEVKKTGSTGIELWPKKHGTQREELDALGIEKFATMLKVEGIGFGGTTTRSTGEVPQFIPRTGNVSLSWQYRGFNARVLALADDSSLPLLERRRLRQ